MGKVLPARIGAAPAVVEELEPLEVVCPEEGGSTPLLVTADDARAETDTAEEAESAMAGTATQLEYGYGCAVRCCKSMSHHYIIKWVEGVMGWVGGGEGSF